MQKISRFSLQSKSHFLTIISFFITWRLLDQDISLRNSITKRKSLQWRQRLVSKKRISSNTNISCTLFMTNLFIQSRTSCNSTMSRTFSNIAHFKTESWFSSSCKNKKMRSHFQSTSHSKTCDYHENHVIAQSSTRKRRHDTTFNIKVFSHAMMRKYYTRFFDRTFITSIQSLSQWSVSFKVMSSLSKRCFWISKSTLDSWNQFSSLLISRSSSRRSRSKRSSKQLFWNSSIAISITIWTWTQSLSFTSHQK